MNRAKIICSFLVLIFILVPFMIRADGVIVRPLPKGDWTLADEGSQQAFINYEGGTEKLIVAVDIKQESPDAVWIIPIPGKPEQVGIDIVSKLPMFSGSEVISKARISFSRTQEKTFGYLVSSQIWTLPFTIFFISLSGTSASPNYRPISDSVSVGRHIEKEGMIVETVTAKTKGALYDYLAAKGLKVEQGSISVLEPYIEKNYVFVVAWINPTINSQGKETERGIFITFPSSKIYYPLIPTSAYREKTIPVTIRVLGHVKPELFPEIKPYAVTKYLTKRPQYVSSGVRRARCKSDVSMLRTQLEIYWASYNRYPLSLEELRQDPSFVNQVDSIIKDAERNCMGIFNYSGDGNNYQIYGGMGNKEVFFIDSQGHEGEKAISDMLQGDFSKIEKFYKGSENAGVWKGQGDYTKITINAPAKLLKKDLWMEKGRPLKTSLALLVANFFDNYPSVFSIFLYLVFASILSWLAGGIAGLIYFHRFKKYALIGLANVATLIGFIVALLLARKRGTIPTSRRLVSFVFVFSLVFLGLTLLVVLV